MSRSINTKVYKSMPENFDVISDTTVHTGKWAAIIVIDSPSFSTTDNIVGGEEDKDLSGLAGLLDQGFEILGNWTSIKLTAGTIIAYKG